MALQGGPVVAPPGGRAPVGGPTVGVYGCGPQLLGYPTVAHPAAPYGGGGGPTGPGGPGPGCVGVAGGPVGQLQNGGVVVVVHGVAPCGVGWLGGPLVGPPGGGGATQLLHPWAVVQGWPRWPAIA